MTTTATIAVLEDDADVRELVAGVLAGRGYGVREFGTLGAACAGLQDAPPDLLIVDVDLPDGCGLDLIGRVRDRSGRGVPAIVLSGRRDERDFARGFGVGAVDYLTKPFAPAELLARCGRQLQAGADAAPGPLTLGATVFLRYVLEAELGRGASGRVFLARDLRMRGARVALKALTPLPHEELESRIRFVRETYALARIADPHVVRVHDVGAAEGHAYAAMEYVEGPSLLARVVEGGPLSVDEATPLARGLLRALAAVGREGLVHRDVKPANVLLRGGRLDAPVLIDFGLAKLPFDRGLTQPHVMVGTPSYLAPEAIVGADPDARTDLFSLGLTLRFALTGVDVFPELRGVALLEALACGPIPLPPLPAGPLLTLLRALLGIHPSSRPRGADEALRCLA